MEEEWDIHGSLVIVLDLWHRRRQGVKLERKIPGVSRVDLSGTPNANRIIMRLGAACVWAMMLLLQRKRPKNHLNLLKRRLFLRNWQNPFRRLMCQQEPQQK